MTAANLSNQQYALKRLWPQSRIENEVYPDHPLLAMIPKDTNFVGDSLVLALRYADPQGRSADFATAQANITANKGARFLLTRASDYQLVRLTTEVIQASKNDAGALVRTLDTEMQAGMNNIGASLARALYGDGTGYIGQSNSTASPITLVNANDIVNFEVGMTIVAAATTTGAIRSGSGVITAVDRDAGTITYTGTITSLAANDYLFVQGDAPNNGGTNLKVTGLLGWIPSSAPTSTAFFGLDRTPDPTRLAGLRIDISSMAPEEGLVTVLSKQSREGAKPDMGFCNHVFYRSVAIALGSKVEYAPMSSGDVGFTGLRVIGPKGEFKMFADQDCPSAKLFSLTMKTWKLYSLNSAPQIFDLDGDRLGRVYNADEWEARLGYFAQMGCTAPGWNANVTVPS